MYVYSVYTAMLCMQKMLKSYTKNVRTLDILVEFLIGYLQHSACPISVCCTLLYIRHRVPGDFKHPVDIKKKQRFICTGSKCTDSSIKLIFDQYSYWLCLYFHNNHLFLCFDNISFPDLKEICLN